MPQAIRWLTDYLFGRGKHVRRKGPAHSSDRHGIFKDLWQLRKALGIDLAHSGSVDIYDHFGCAPYNDNDVKRERRDTFRPVIALLTQLDDDRLADEASALLAAFEEADAAKRLRNSGKPLLPILLLALLLAACQISHTVEIRDADTVTVLMEGGDTHSRGGQTTDAAAEVGLAP